ncbi:MAG: ATP-binding protein [Crocinitomicaceae bacterium]|nr:ATP-binding protein [Crocinitomicaceae bacterium]MDG1777665.1 ATP-binding protein [Crocinitomicaceae bacterium]
MCELQEIISNGEGVQVEFKTEISNQKHLAATLVAFANGVGGSVLIGVKKSGKIKGVNPSEEKILLDEAISMYTKPHVLCDTVVWKVKHYLVVEIKVDQSKIRHQAKDDQGIWNPFVRIESHTCRTNKIIDLAWKLSDSLEESVKYNEACKDELILKLQDTHLTLSKLYTESRFTLKEVDYNLSCLLYIGAIRLSFLEGNIYYALV